MLAFNPLGVCFSDCVAARLTIAGKLPIHRCRTIESKMGLTVAEVVLMLYLHGLPVHTPALSQSHGQWRATTTVAVSSIAQSSTSHPFLKAPRARPSRLAHRVVGVEAKLCSLVRGVATFFQRVNHRGGS